eukprot:1686333-Rhodomonas_salina.1
MCALQHFRHNDKTLQQKSANAIAASECTFRSVCASPDTNAMRTRRSVRSARMASTSQPPSSPAHRSASICFWQLKAVGGGRLTVLLVRGQCTPCPERATTPGDGCVRLCAVLS